MDVVSTRTCQVVDLGHEQRIARTIADRFVHSLTHAPERVPERAHYRSEHDIADFSMHSKIGQRMLVVLCFGVQLAALTYH